MPETTIADHGGWAGVLSELTAGRDLSSEAARAAMSEILAGNATDAQIAALAVALRMKGETIDEIDGLLAAMTAAGQHVEVPDVDSVIDTCGTGGDRSRSINVSTMAALVVAGAGVRVCKHGNRAASSECGSADLFEALGVAIELSPAGVARCIAEAGIGFCFAPNFHPAARHAVPARKQLGVPTVFNFLGPLANPAGVRRQVLGISDKRMGERLVGVLRSRGALRAFVVYGHDGLDELTTTTTSTVIELDGDEVVSYEVDPAAHGLSVAEPAALRGGNAATNADVTRRVLSGEAGAYRDVVVLNAAAGLIVAGRAADLAAGLGIAAESIDSGNAAAVLDKLVASSQAAASTGD